MTSVDLSNFILVSEHIAQVSNPQEPQSLHMALMDSR